jgi:hypothetical protein
MKIRHTSKLNKPHEWKDFIRDMDLWIMVYDALSYLAKQKIMGALALKAHIQNSEIAYTEMLNKKEMAFFREVRAVKVREYDPDQQLRKMQGEVMCIDLHPKSQLVETLRTTTLCGQFLGLNKGKAFAMMRKDNDEGYEEREAAFSFRLAYPDAGHTVDISLLDLVNMEPFL